MNFRKAPLAMILSMLAMPVSINHAFANQDTSTTQSVPAEPDSTAQSAQDVQVAEIDPDQQVQELIDKYRQAVEAKVRAQGKQNSVVFFEGKGQIAVDKNHTDWSEFRALALNEAVLKARESYLKTLNRDFVQQDIKEYFKAKGLPEPTADDFKSESKLTQLLNKAIAVVDSKLNAELEENGVNPQEFEAAPQTKKQQLFREYIGTKSITRAYGDLSGMFVVKTFEVIEDNGKGTVGVVMALSNAKRDRVKALVESRGNVMPDPEKANPANANIKSKLANMNDTLFLNTGTQLWYDDKGYPMLVSFGQAGVIYTNDPDERTMEREAARGYAEDNAWGLLAGTYNMNGNFARDSMRGQEKTKDKVFEFAAGNVRTSETAGIQRKIMSVTEESSKMTSSIRDVTGVGVEHTWLKKHPVTGKEMTGVVVVWHPVRIQNAEDLQNGREPVATETNKPTSAHEAGSEDFFDAADF
ncbi:hypothetical protein NF212_10415 [Parasalinivibrio latis]|uniref:DUF6844 domain-containing protein n=1 Tax=Parasalinivibrio latis TaxID=2952610 RepID=UPI0030E1AEBA